MDGFKMIDNTNGEKIIHLVKPDDLKFKVLKFACNDDDDFNAWKKSFKRVLSKVCTCIVVHFFKCNF